MTIRQEVIHTATFPSSLRTTWPTDLKQTGWRVFRFEGQSIIHFDASVYGQRMAALETDACAAQVKDRTSAPR